MDEKIHAMLKQHCLENGLVMKSLVEKLIINEIKKNEKNEYKKSI